MIAKTSIVSSSFFLFRLPLGANPSLFSACVALVLIGNLSGCGFAYRNTIGLFLEDEQTEPRQSFESPGDAQRETEKQTRRIDIEALKTKGDEAALGAVEIIWEIPDSPADAYVIHYGFDRTDLDQKITVQTEDLERFEDPRHGYVYRHLMSNIPLDRSLFVAMATVRGDETSDRTEVFEVQALKEGKPNK